MNHSILFLLSAVLVIGILSPVYAQEQTSSSVEVTVTSDKLSYYFDDTAIIQGTVSEIIFPAHSKFQPLPVQINISGPNFSHTASMYPDTSLNYETTLDLVQVLGVNVGAYVVTATYGDVVSNTTFYVSTVPIEESEQIESSLTIQTDKSEYVLSEPILINGISSEIILYEGVKYSVTNPMGQLVANGNLFTTDGEFDTSIVLSSVTSILGAYSITVEYADQTASTIFNLVENVVEIEELLVSDSMILNLDQSEYLLNGQMTLSGEITNFDPDTDIYYLTVYFNFKDSSGKVPIMNSAIKENSAGSLEIEFSLTAIPDESGKFSNTFTIRPVAFSEGNYTV